MFWALLENGILPRKSFFHSSLSNKKALARDFICMMILFLLPVVSSWALNIGLGPRRLLESPHRRRRLAKETLGAGGTPNAFVS